MALNVGLELNNRFNRTSSEILFLKLATGYRKRDKNRNISNRKELNLFKL
jgi:hypothetical protein